MRPPPRRQRPLRVVVVMGQVEALRGLLAEAVTVVRAEAESLRRNCTVAATGAVDDGALDIILPLEELAERCDVALSRTPGISDGALPRQDGQLRDDLKSPITPERLDGLEAVARAATQGAWFRSGGRADLFAGKRLVNGHSICVEPSQISIAHVFYDKLTGEGFNDAAHIATFDPPTTLSLIEQVRSSTREVERLREALKLAQNEIANLNAVAAETYARLRRDAVPEGYAPLPITLTPDIAHALESNIAECIPPSEIHVSNWRETWARVIELSARQALNGGLSRG